MHDPELLLRSRTREHDLLILAQLVDLNAVQLIELRAGNHNALSGCLFVSEQPFLRTGQVGETMYTVDIGNDSRLSSDRDGGSRMVA